MRIPAAQFSSGPVGFGQVWEGSNAQFGQMAVKSDGRLEDAFFKGADTLRDLNDANVQKFISQVAKLEVQSLQEARARFEAGQKPNEYELGSLNRSAIDGAAKESGVAKYAWTDSDWRGVITSAKVSSEFNPTTQPGPSRQELQVKTDANGTTATLSSRFGQGQQVISVPVNSDGSLEFSKLTEELTLDTPWLSKEATSGNGKNSIKDIDDPRLERVALAAELGFLLSENDLGPGWECQNLGGQQTWTNYNETLVLNPAEHSFTISATSSHTGHAGSSDSSCDYEVADSVRWQNGTFQRV